MSDKGVYKKIVENEPYCQMCGSTYFLQIHHIYYRSQGGLTVPKNLIRLCAKCHSLVHSNKDYYQPLLIQMQIKKYGDINPNELVRHNKWVKNE